MKKKAQWPYVALGIGAVNRPTVGWSFLFKIIAGLLSDAYWASLIG